MLKFIAAGCAFVGGWALASFFFKSTNLIAFTLGTFPVPWAALIGLAVGVVVLKLKDA